MIGIVLSNEEAKKLEEALVAIKLGHECGCVGSADLNETCAVCQALADVAEIHLSNDPDEARRSRSLQPDVGTRKE